ncbi:MAG: PQQ-like beta-propeller repeat protein [Planctomycetia bacterium]|nr:PQQ-like beta-propeller repeat protein [Planctomycetia bacterium]
MLICTRSFLAVGLALALLLPSGLHADDWPQWRGPNRDGVWTETGILQSFPADALKFLWRTPVGLGLSSPVVAEGRVFVTDVDLTRPLTKERVLCFEAASGKPLWTYVYEAEYPEAGPNQFIQGPIPTPICHGGKVYTIGRTQLLCLDAVGGKLLWKTALDKEYDSQESLTYASPLIEGNLLIIYSGRFSGPATKSVIAIDKDSGKTAWRAVEDYAAMSSPVVVSAAGKRQLIVWSQQAVTSLDPATGEVYWREATRPVNQSSAVATPVVQGNRLLIGGLLLELDPAKPAATVLWPETKSPTRRNLSNTSTPLLRGDHVFSARTSGYFVCLDAKTGNEVWETEKVTDQVSGASVHLTTNGDNAFLYTDRGELILAHLRSDGYREISRTPLVEPTFEYQGKKFVWAPPAYANRCVFSRSDKELVCASLAE